MRYKTPGVMTRLERIVKGIDGRPSAFGQDQWHCQTADRDEENSDKARDAHGGIQMALASDRAYLQLANGDWIKFAHRARFYPFDRERGRPENC